MLISCSPPFGSNSVGWNAHLQIIPMKAKCRSICTTTQITRYYGTKKKKIFFLFCFLDWLEFCAYTGSEFDRLASCAFLFKYIGSMWNLHSKQCLQSHGGFTSTKGNPVALHRNQPPIYSPCNTWADIFVLSHTRVPTLYALSLHSTSVTLRVFHTHSFPVLYIRLRLLPVGKE